MSTWKDQSQRRVCPGEDWGPDLSPSFTFNDLHNWWACVSPLKLFVFLSLCPHGYLGQAYLSHHVRWFCGTEDTPTVEENQNVLL